jgi:hypothetical protein
MTNVEADNTVEYASEEEVVDYINQQFARVRGQHNSIADLRDDSYCEGDCGVCRDPLILPNDCGWMRNSPLEGVPTAPVWTARDNAARLAEAERRARRMPLWTQRVTPAMVESVDYVRYLEQDVVVSVAMVRASFEGAVVRDQLGRTWQL